jgi:hypothetical protein
MKFSWLMLVALFYAVGHAQAEDKLGRLFQTPAERANLDYLRQISAPPEKMNASTPENEDVDAMKTTEAVPSVIQLQGYVKRSDGKGTVWVNQQPVMEADKQAKIGVERMSSRDGKVRLKVPGSEKAVVLKAGQFYDPQTGAVVDYVGDLPQSATATVPPSRQPVTATTSKP